MYIPEEYLLWDFWFAPKQADEPFHLYHLQAPRSLPDPHQRHFIAEIGHAISDDLVNWRRVGTAIQRGEPGSWDDRAIWTGCTIFHDGLYFLFYTALSSTDSGRAQRIGVATSVDQIEWSKHEANPLLTADPRWYETVDVNPQADEAFRDPFVYVDPGKGCWFMLFCARGRSGPSDERGVIGLATSTDLFTWEALPPIHDMGEFGQLEVPQLVQIGERWYLVFCTGQHSRRRLLRTGERGEWFGTHYLIADSPYGPFLLAGDDPLVGDKPGSYYAGRIETGLGDRPLFFAWRQYDDDGNFVGGLSNPASVVVDDDGRLKVDVRELWD